MDTTLTSEEINALIVDRHGSRVYTRIVDGRETFFLRRDGVEVRPAEYCSNAQYLRGEQAAGAIPDDPTGRELYENSIGSGELTGKEYALAFLNAFVADPQGRLAIIRRREPRDERASRR